MDQMPSTKGHTKYVDLHFSSNHGIIGSEGFRES
jgi:hypothetical protein